MAIRVWEFDTAAEAVEIFHTRTTTSTNVPASKPATTTAKASAPKPTASTTSKKRGSGIVGTVEGMTADAYYALPKEERKAFRASVGGDWSNGFAGRVDGAATSEKATTTKKAHKAPSKRVSHFSQERYENAPIIKHRDGMFGLRGIKEHAYNTEHTARLAYGNMAAA